MSLSGGMKTWNEVVRKDILDCAVMKSMVLNGAEHISKTKQP